MKGIILAGGTGSRLYPLTKITNKHLLPVYNKPMIYYPLFTLKEAGIRDILIVSGRGHAGHFLELLGSGHEMGLHLTYEIQEKSGGIAEALSLAEDFVDGDKMIVVLGDNVFTDNLKPFVDSYKKQEKGARVLLKKVKNPKAYGVAEVVNKKIVNIVEKPANPKSDLAVCGLYMYDSEVFKVIKGLSPSKRNELEITDVNNHYLKQGTLNFSVLKGFWGDCGESFDTLTYTAAYIKTSRLAKIDEYLKIKK